ncbi:MAG: hypothetical protein R2749_08320 [Acidimicrobiales bacterium]
MASNPVAKMSTSSSWCSSPHCTPVGVMRVIGVPFADTSTSDTLGRL